MNLRFLVLIVASFVIGLICIEVLITLRGYTHRAVIVPAVKPFKNLLTVSRFNERAFLFSII